jgi:hypothetical protein
VNACMAAGPSTTDRCAYGVIAGLDELCARRVPKESATGSRSVDDRPQHPRTGLLALTFGTLLSSQGADAHRYWTSRSVSGQLAKHYSVGFVVSNPEVCPTPPAHHSSAAESAGSEGMEPVPSGGQPAFGALTTVGGRWQRSQIASAALPALPLTLAYGGGRARRHAGGGARTRTEPTLTVIFVASQSNRTGPVPTLRPSRRPLGSEPDAPPAARTPTGCPEV